MPQAPEIKMSFQRFAQTIKLGQPDHIWLGPLKLYYGQEKCTVQMWRSHIQELKRRPATVGGRG